MSPELFAFPLSLAQQRLWFLQQLEPELTTYNETSGLRLHGLLNPEVLARSISEIVRRHEILRTCFPSADGTPRLVTLPAAPVPLPLIDLSGLAEPVRETEAHEVMTTEARRPFDLASGPVLRTSLLRLAADDHVLVLVIHHIVSDAWSTEVFLNELASLYRVFAAGAPSTLPALSMQYADYAVWQRAHLQGAALERQLAYWRRKLGGPLGRLAFPTDHPRRTPASHQGGAESVVLSKDLAKALQTLSRDEGATLFMTLLAVFKLLLFRLTGQEDVVVGIPISVRHHQETERLIGCFINTLALRTDLSGDLGFTELLRRVRETALEAYDHQDLPFERLVEELQPERALDQHPIFDVLFNFVSTAGQELAIPELRLSRVMSPEPEAKFLMTLYVTEAAGEITLRLVYERSRLSPARVAALLEQYQCLLNQIVLAPRAPIHSYSLVTPRCRELLPDPRVELAEPDYPSVPSMFLSWVQRRPARPAVRQGGRTWSYEELSDSAQALGQVLTERGLARGAVIAVMGPRSFGLIVAFTAVLLGGAVLLPIDPGLPKARRRLMLREAGARHVLIVGAGPEKESLQELDSLSATRVDPDTGRALERVVPMPPGRPRLPEPRPEDPAYVFFTSGTTGVPKAVLGCHKGLSHFLTWQRETFAIGPEDRVAQLTALSFDVLLRDVFLPLVSGASLCLPDQGEAVDPDQVLPWLSRAGVTVLHAVPSLTSSWLGGSDRAISLPSLRWVFLAGETLTEKLVRRWRGACSAAGIVNLYGATETTLVKCCYQVPHPAPPGDQSAGWPLPQTQALVLSEDGRLCGIGEPGEIVLRTPFRSLGYSNNPGEQQKRFRSNPFRHDERDLLYWTGDRGRYQPDGSLVVIGRVDDQVKIRGCRVEPGEVASTLLQHPGVRQAVVLAPEGQAGERRLVAYVVAHQQPIPTSSELRRFLAERLPEYMLPSVFVPLDAFPLTSNGKVDRQELSALEVDRTATEQAFVPPRSPIEVVLVGLWAELLEKPRVGVHDDFFHLGGHSLLATRMVSRIRSTLAVRLTLRELFERPTIAELATWIEQDQDRSLDARLASPIGSSG